MRRVGALVFALVLVFIAGPAAAGALRVVATIPDLGSLAATVGGDDVEVEVIAKGPQDPHFIEPRPSFIRLLHRADLFIRVGMDLEIGWVPTLLRSARNARIQPGAGGFLDASTAIAALEIPTGRVDRSMGDVHPFGNPHYLTDPVNGLHVAKAIRDRLIELRPEEADRFRSRYAVFAGELVRRLVGEALAARTSPEQIASVVAAGRLEQLRAEQEGVELGGWLGAVSGHVGTKAVQDHRLWPYFASRFGLELVATLEPKPGIAPTTRHLAGVISMMEADGVKLVLSTGYFDARHARWVSEQSGARVVPMAHQVGSREGTEDYLAMIDYNVRAVLDAM